MCNMCLIKHGLITAHIFIYSEKEKQYVTYARKNSVSNKNAGK